MIVSVNVMKVLERTLLAIEYGSDDVTITAVEEFMIQSLSREDWNQHVVLALQGHQSVLPTVLQHLSSGTPLPITVRVL